MGCSKSKEPTTDWFEEAEQSAKAAKAETPPVGQSLPSTEKVEKAASKQKSHREPPPSQPPAPKDPFIPISISKDDFSGATMHPDIGWMPLDRSDLPEAPSGTRTVDGVTFYSYLQAMARNPTKYLLFDPRPRQVYEIQSIKGAECLWSEEDPTELWRESACENARELVVRKTTGVLDGSSSQEASSPSQIRSMASFTNKTVLLFGTGGVQDSEVKKFCYSVLETSRSKPYETVLLELPFYEFAVLYPDTITSDNSRSLTSLAQFLDTKEQKGFCIYGVDYEAMDYNVESLSTYGVQVVLNMDEDGTTPGQIYCATAGKHITFIRVEGATHAQRLSNTVDTLHALRDHKKRAAVYERFGQGACEAVLWFLVECGVPFEDAVDLVETRSGGFRLPSAPAMDALEMLAENISEETYTKFGRRPRVAVVKSRFGVVQKINGDPPPIPVLVEKSPETQNEAELKQKKSSNVRFA